ncbi:MAG: phosphoribosylglycinamide formyltransferase [Spirochaetaceae bacterium 4572_7]|nr:MAG: phosphoribosylglycinamide formyltransferase [Spirochaetaceae bacterium 4572_7]
MAKLAILASGNGSNFSAIAQKIKDSTHSVACMICDRKDAYVFERAKEIGIKAYYVTFYKRDKKEAEQDISEILKIEGIDFIALAGFMRILSPSFINLWDNKIINIHPALLPKHPGAHGIEDSFNSEDLELGVTIHYVDSGMDTGSIIYQESFTRDTTESLESVEKKIHLLEHKIYPKILLKKLNNLNRNL